MNKINFDLRLFYFPNGLSATFIDGQYKYDRISPEIKAMEGDIVIDAGGCFGDTGLYFAHEVGESGHVYTFEFIPSNLAIMRKNFSLSENLNKRITIIEHPLWHKSKDPLYYMVKDQQVLFQPIRRIMQMKKHTQYLLMTWLKKGIFRTSISLRWISKELSYVH